ncbi:MAG TPA: cation diffusion facilitator family transporter [Dongiaceae bacterium]|nr:cation diffusion facilitator family transporter [Dongiaceae bacterium]
MTTPADLSHQHHARLLHLASTASVLVATSLLLIKAYAWWISGSVSLLAALADSALDALASLLNFAAVRYSLQPADAEHRFGHGKAESLAGLGQSLFIMGSAVFLLVRAIDRMRHPQPLEQLDVAVGVMLVSILMTFGLVWYQRRVIAQTQSPAIQADSLHYLSDLLTNTGVIVALLLSWAGWQQVDPILAIAIALYIFYTAVRIWNQSIQLLLDRELPEEEQRRIEAIALRQKEVLGVHGLRTRQSGHVKIVQLHVELDGNMPLALAHRICDQIEADIRREFPNADVLIHQDPFRGGARSEVS